MRKTSCAEALSEVPSWFGSEMHACCGAQHSIIPTSAARGPGRPRRRLVLTRIGALQTALAPFYCGRTTWPKAIEQRLTAPTLLAQACSSQTMKLRRESSSL